MKSISRVPILLLVALLLRASMSGAADLPNNATNYAAPKTAFAPDSLPPDLPAAPATGPALCRRNFLTPEQGKAVLDFALATYPSIELRRTHADHLRACIQAGAGLDPLPKRTPLNPILGEKRVHDGYTVQNVALETIPGFWACGNLYRPLNAAGHVPAVLNTHGHSKDLIAGGRFAAGTQQRCATLARMGAVALSLEMFGYGESLNQVPKEAHESTLAMSIQLWNNIRAIDFLESLPDVDPKRIAVTGESGGGTQSFLLTALDGRIAVNVPVVMVSSYFFGGCMCESGRPVHRSDGHFCTNCEIASLCAPRPMLVISDGKDWTQDVPKVEFPFLQKIYSLYGAPENVENVHLADEGHDYGPSKRLAMYRFLARKFNLNLDQAQVADGQLDEPKVTIEKPEDLHCFADAAALPAHALHGVVAIEESLAKLQLRPHWIRVGPSGKQIQLFDGKNLDGWIWTQRPAKGNSDPPASVTIDDVWSVKDGLLHCKGKPTGYIRTENEFENYVLTVEQRHVSKGNGGILFAISGPDKVWPRCLEAQGANGEEGDIRNVALFKLDMDKDRVEPARLKRIGPSSEKEPGEWEVFEITVDMGKVTLKVNGQLQNQLTAQESLVGHIGLQSEGGEMEYRQIELTLLGDLESRSRRSADSAPSDKSQ